MITIDEAISMLMAILKDRKSYKGSSGNEAIKLGLDALRRIKELRSGRVVNPNFMLPRETKD